MIAFLLFAGFISSISSHSGSSTRIGSSTDTRADVRVLGPEKEYSPGLGLFTSAYMDFSFILGQYTITTTSISTYSTRTCSQQSSVNAIPLLENQWVYVSTSDYKNYFDPDADFSDVDNPSYNASYFAPVAFTVAFSLLMLNAMISRI